VAGLITHITTYAAVNAFLIAIWVLVGGGSTNELQMIANDPTTAISHGFWPVWPILGWGVFLVIHAGSAISNGLFGRRARRRRRYVAQQAAKASKNLAGEVSSAIERAQERRAEREARRDARLAPSAPATPAPPAAPEGAPPPEPPPGERKWVTVMFCDIADSTRLNEQMGDDEWHRVLRRVRTIVRSALRARGGDEVGTQGDGTLARFASPPDAVLCGVDIQENLKGARATGSTIPDVRIGVHAGEAVEDEGDLVGRVINLASRVTTEAEPGEILVTEPVADQLVGRLELEDKGLRELKGLAQPRHLLAVRWSQEVS
jgi:class 3 adenylate cyclase